MDTKKYIKVTPRGEQPRVIMATLRNFYVAQGAKIEQPTPNEIADAFPEEKAYVKAMPERGADDRITAELSQWKAKANEMAETIKTITQERDTAKERVRVLEGALKETEALVAKLSQEKKSRKAKGSAE